MGKVWQVVEWQSGSGQWHCNDTSQLSKGSAMWWIPCRILGISPADYVKLLIEQYHADVYWSEGNNLLLWSWEKQSEMRKFKNFINARARAINFII